MTTTLMYVVYAAGWTFLSLFLGTLFRNRLWTPDGMRFGIGNRDTPPTPNLLGGRADRAAANTLENFVIFAALALTAHIAGVDNERVALGAAIFFWARVAYTVAYLAGITVVRTIIWAIGGVGLVMIALQML
jgi:uncharacterized MAPEG superfamily protein